MFDFFEKEKVIPLEENLKDYSNFDSGAKPLMATDAVRKSAGFSSFDHSFTHPFISRSIFFEGFVQQDMFLTLHSISNVGQFE